MIRQVMRIPRAILGRMGPIDALYEDGLLRPVSPLPLRSGERVTVIVVRRSDATRWDVARLAAHGDDDLSAHEYVCEETGDEVVLMKDADGRVAGFEKLNFSIPKSDSLHVARETIPV